MKPAILSIALALITAATANAHHGWVFPVTPAPVIYQPQVVYQPMQLQQTLVVPRRTCLGNRWFGPRVFGIYAPTQPAQPTTAKAIQPAEASK